MKNIAYLSIIAGAALWGTTGLFVTRLYDYSFTPLEVVTIRLSFAAILLILYLAIVKPSYLLIKLRDLPFFIGTGIVSIAFFNYFFFTVMEQASISLAVVLLYTGPVFVAIISRFTFKEAFTRNKTIALVLMFIGCAFTVGLLPTGSLNASMMTILFGIASGFFYALYSIFGKYVSGRYHALTITVYSMIIGSAFLLPVTQIWQKADVLLTAPVLANGVSLAFFATVLAYVFYTTGLKTVESSRAAILSTIEPVVAIIIGLLVFQEIISFWQFMGIVAILGSVLLTVERRATRRYQQAKAG
ncbi:EamA family transporter [Paenalkalicoccus suaedae]|uniref:EamA family transporter n=1 Tax=Paenalkalicoccus suaedae TaxID=2592382 RepID=A0A859FFK4_9BACI|nr:EamA family transporter [Paenalkalicoccus suaedae]QKS72143.1 EamA family transporter [Paenalkalicoccus suaedae]